MIKSNKNEKEKHKINDENTSCKNSDQVKDIKDIIHLKKKRLKSEYK